MRYFAYARTAFKYGLVSLGFKPGDRLLVPDYVCEALLHPIRQLGIRPTFFPVNDSLEPQWDALDSIASKVAYRAVLMVHYFGQPQDIQRYETFCTDHELLLIEDNAHGFGGKLHGKLLGTFGDLGFTSPRKILNIASGGILYINGKEQAPPPLRSFNLGLVSKVLRCGFRRWPMLKVCASVLAKRLPNFSDPSSFHEPVVLDQLADESSSWNISDTLADASILHEMAFRRRQRWLFWHNEVLRVGLKPVFGHVHPESSPWYFPAYCESPIKRKRVLDIGLKKGVIFSSWPALPREVVSSGGDAVKRWHHLICVPLCQEPPESFTV